MKKLLVAVLAVMLAFAPVAWAAVDVKESGSDRGKAEHLNFDDGFTVTFNNNTAEVDLDRTVDVTFQTTLLAMGRTNAASSLASSATQLYLSSLPYVFFRKSVGGAGSCVDSNPGTTLPDGTPGQVTVLFVGSLMTGGTWKVTPTTCTGFSYLTFDTINDQATLLYVDDTIGWIIISHVGVTVTYPAYGTNQ